MLAGASPAQRIALAAPLAERIAPRAPLLPAARLLLAAGYAYGGRFEDAEEELERAGAAAAAVRAPLLGVLARVVRPLLQVGARRPGGPRRVAPGGPCPRARGGERPAQLGGVRAHPSCVRADGDRSREAIDEASARREEQRQRGIGQRRAPLDGLGGNLRARRARPLGGGGHHGASRDLARSSGSHVILPPRSGARGSAGGPSGRPGQSTRRATGPSRFSRARRETATWNTRLPDEPILSMSNSTDAG